MFQFPGFPHHGLFIHPCVTGLLPAGFPHSDIDGSLPACGSPSLFAACHVLLRRLVPWHPPCALVRLILLRLTFVIVDPETNYNSSGQLTFFIATGLLRLSLVFSTLCAVVKVLLRHCRLSGFFRTLKTIQSEERQFLLSNGFRHSLSCSSHFPSTKFPSQSTYG